MNEKKGEKRETGENKDEKQSFEEKEGEKKIQVKVRNLDSERKRSRK